MIIIGPGSVESTKPIQLLAWATKNTGTVTRCKRTRVGTAMPREFRPSCANRETPETGTDTGGKGEKKPSILTEPLFELLLLDLVLAP